MERILVVDDSIVTLTLIGDILRDTFQLELQENGANGIAAAKQFQPDLILLDVHLPDIDGYEVCRALKQERATKEIPVVFITSMDSERERVKGFEAGADDYVVKPFYPGELLARVKAHLATRRAKAQAIELERLKMFTEMAVALCHEINNPLTTLYGSLHLLRNRASDPETLAGMRVELDRIRDITGKLARASRVAETSYVGDVTMIDLDSI